MFPNPQDALPLPPRPSLDHYKKRAKDLLKAGRSSDPTAIRAWCANWIDSLVRLSDLKITPDLPVDIDDWTDRLAAFARQQLSETCTLSAAQFVIARAQGFESWPKLASHLAAITGTNFPINNFELAADAIVAGDLATLGRLLREHPDLIHARSTRRTQGTLLHYVSANGVEGYRQKTPKNILQIAELLLQSGAAVNASAEIYGRSTTLELVATSLHPARAGVQDALLEVLINHGAILDVPATAIRPARLVVNACLANGRAQAAQFLAHRGAGLDLEAAAGVGRLDVVKSFFDENGNLEPPATQLQMERGFLWACEYGQNETVEFFLQRGVNFKTQAGTAQTALHWAVIGGHEDTIKLLLERGASLDAMNAYGGTALGQAEWSAVHGPSAIDYVRIADLLRLHGAKS
jgi:hypothetical protein